MDAAFATVREVYRPKPDALPTSENTSLDTRTLVALIDGEIAGAVCIYQKATALHVSQLAVVPKSRRLGVARQLLKSANETATACGANQLRLNTIQETGNVAIFERLGFSICATNEATWCISDQFPQLTDVTMTRQCTESGD